MARVHLECSCGHKFFVGSAGLSPGKGVDCPACDERVRVPAAAAAPARPRTAPSDSRPVDLRPVPDGPRERPRAMRLYLGGAAAAAVLLLGLILFLTRSPGVDPERQAELDREARRRAFEKLTSQVESPPPATSESQAPIPPSPPPRALQAPSAPTPAAPVAVPRQRVMPAPSTPAPEAAISAELLDRFRREVMSLHPFYLGLVLGAGERPTAERVLASGRGYPPDAALLAAVLGGEKLKAVRDETSTLRILAARLQRESDATLPVDQITLEDGRVLDCRIVDESGDAVKVSRMLARGLGGQMTFPRQRITRLDRGKGSGKEFADRWEACRKGPIRPLVELMGWSKQHELLAQAKLVASKILELDPSNPPARALVGLPADPVEASSDPARDGQISYQGRSWNPADLRNKLEKEGYVLLNGSWFSRKDRTFSVPGLFRTERTAEAPISIGGTAVVCHEVEVSFRTSGDPASGRAIDQPETKELRRFYSPELPVRQSGSLPPGAVLPPRTADLDIRPEIEEGALPRGTPIQGELLVSVPVGAPILDASVMTAAEVKTGGAITVYFVGAANGESTKVRLYACQGRESQIHPIPSELVRGRTDLTLSILIEGTAGYTLKIERHKMKSPVYRGRLLVSPGYDIMHFRQVPEYKAMLFPSTPSTTEVFRLRLGIADPAPQLDALFAGFADALR